MITVKKNNIEFNVQGTYSKEWFSTWFMQWNWEDYTFKILDHFASRNKVYIDIGAWIGPTVLYASPQYKHIYCFEPDPIAISRLKMNMEANNFNNITLIEKGISNKKEIINFGGNGELGNSMSTLLVNDNKFIDEGGEELFQSKDHRAYGIIEISTILFDDFIAENNIDAKDIGLIKMDIEGGESIVVPAMKLFLEKIKPNFYISIHWVFLKKSQIEEILDILFNIYPNCYKENLTDIVTKEDVINYKLTCLVFTK